MKKAILWGLVAFAVVAFFAWLVIALVGMMGVDAKCTALGYADSSLSVNFLGYCETRIRDTDYVIPVGEAKVWMETTGKELMGR